MTYTEFKTAILLLGFSFRGFHCDRIQEKYSKDRIFVNMDEKTISIADYSKYFKDEYIDAVQALEQIIKLIENK